VGTYGLFWATETLAAMAEAAAVHQYLARRGVGPTPTELAAAWAAEDAEQPQVWQQLPAQLRAAAASRDAEMALAETKARISSTDLKFYREHVASFWSQVCLRSVDVTVAGAQGLREAETIAANPRQMVGFAAYCLTPDGFTAQSRPFRALVGGLAPGHAGPVAESYGYEVVQVTSRTEIPFSRAVAKDIDVVAVQGGSEQQPPSNSSIAAICKAAHIKVNPRYWPWSTLTGLQ